MSPTPTEIRFGFERAERMLETYGGHDHSFLEGVKAALGWIAEGMNHPLFGYAVGEGE